MIPTFEQYMLENGMNDPDRLPPDDLAKWRMRYALIYAPPTPPAPTPHHAADGDDMSKPVGT